MYDPDSKQYISSSKLVPGDTSSSSTKEASGLVSRMFGGYELQELETSCRTQRIGQSSMRRRTGEKGVFNVERGPGRV